VVVKGVGEGTGSALLERRRCRGGKGERVGGFDRGGDREEVRGWEWLGK
jgi:hypothetical protein